MMTTANWYSIAKALHLIGMVSWMAGMFYLVRIMVYHAMANERPPAEKELMGRQFTEMEWKSYRVIIQPAIIITWTFGCVLLSLQPVWLEQGWMHLKLALLVLLTLYTHSLKGHIKALEAGASSRSHLYFRALNEAPTIALAGIVFLAVFKERINYAIYTAGMLAFVGLIAWGIRAANRKNNKN